MTGPVGVLEVEGWAGTSSEDRHDLIIAIDVSESTGLPSGVDVNAQRQDRSHAALEPGSPAAAESAAQMQRPG